nr:MAG TPA: hypothetical protein [Bacteriophage sp.]
MVCCSFYISVCSRFSSLISQLFSKQSCVCRLSNLSKLRTKHKRINSSA